MIHEYGSSRAFLRNRKAIFEFLGFGDRRNSSEFGRVERSARRKNVGVGGKKTIDGDGVVRRL